MKKIKLNRKTAETEISLTLSLKGSGKSKISTGVGFFDHMLTLMSFHGCLDLEVSAKGDLEVDAHHTVEDVGILIGQALRQAIPESQNFQRYAVAYVPMDEAMARAVVDISGRSFLVFKSVELNPKVGEFDTELVREFFQAFASNALITLHLEILYGENTHHKIEALFKAAGVALRRAVSDDPGRSGVASTKGML